MSQTALSQSRNILVRSANWVGDAIMTTPTLRTIRRRFPGARITLLAKPWVMPVFAHNPHVDAVMVYDDAGRHKGLKGLWRLAGELGQGRFDLAVLLQNAFEAALLAWLAHIPHRLGFTTDARTLLLTHPVRNWRDLKKGHLVDYYLGLLQGAGIKPAGRKLELFLTAPELQAARTTLGDMGIVGNRPIVGINPGATFGTAKRWPAGRFVALGRRLIREKGARVLVFGGPGEAGLGEQVQEQTGAGCHNLCNRTSLRQAMALIGCCDAFVTNDSGLMHVAAALDIAQAAIIGPTDPRATGPVNELSRVVRSVIPCERAPCLLPHCPIDHRCMRGIDVDAVFGAVESLMQSGGGA